MSGQIAVSLSDILRRASAEETPARERGLPEAQVETLREIADVYALGCRFKAGDLVTPRDALGMTQAGEPHIVLEVFPEPVRFLARDTWASDDHCSRIDMRIAVVAKSATVRAFAVESWRFEPYTLKAEG